MTARKKIEEKVMKAQQFLQVSSEIIGKHRHRSDVTRTTSTYLQICVMIWRAFPGGLGLHCRRSSDLTAKENLP
jgi:hypothetical protein